MNGRLIVCQIGTLVIRRMEDEEGVKELVQYVNHSAKICSSTDSFKSVLSDITSQFKWSPTKNCGVLPSAVIFYYEIPFGPGVSIDLPKRYKYTPKHLWFDRCVEEGYIQFLDETAHHYDHDKIKELRAKYQSRENLFDPLIRTLGKTDEPVTKIYPTDEMIKTKLRETLEHERHN